MTSRRRKAPTTASTTSIFLSSFDAGDHSLIASTYFGGSGSDMLHALVSDPAGNVFLAGESPSLDLPVTPGAIDSYFQG